MKHNETLNVWTHLIGFVLVVMAIGYVARQRNTPHFMKENLILELGGYFSSMISNLVPLESSNIHSLKENLALLKITFV